MNKKNILILGDTIAIAILTYIGFIFHNQTEPSIRMLVVFLPMLLGWFLLAPWFGLFNENNPLTYLSLLWRISLVMLFVSPFAVILRAAWYNSIAMPIVALALGATTALGIYIWRLMYRFIAKKK